MYTYLYIYIHTYIYSAGAEEQRRGAAAALHRREAGRQRQINGVVSKNEKRQI